MPVFLFNNIIPADLADPADFAQKYVIFHECNFELAFKYFLIIDKTLLPVLMIASEILDAEIPQCLAQKSIS